MGKNKKLEKKNKNENDEPKIKKEDKVIKKSIEAQMKQQVAKIKKAVKEGLAKVPESAESPEKQEIIKKEISPEKKAKLEQKKLNRKLKKAEQKAAKVQDGDVKEAKEQGEDAKKEDKKKHKKGSIKAEESVDASSTSPEKKDQKKEPKKIFGGPNETVFVGNLPTNSKRNQIAKLFAPYGKLIGVRFRTANGKMLFKHKMRKESGALNAYVVLDSAEAAAKSLALNGSKFKDQLLRVQKTESKEEQYNPQKTVFVGNLKFSANDEKLHQIFSNCGDIEYVRTLQSPDKKGCIGVAYVCFKNADSVGLALELKGTMLDDRPIHVERYSTNKLGAKERRDAEAKMVQTKKGKGKAKMQAGKKGVNKQGAQNKDTKVSDATNGDGGAKDGSSGDKKKKSEFRGVKSEVIKKKKPKKKLQSQMKRLASKIAPKD